jgi:CheY-like chemotaxis protein
MLSMLRRKGRILVLDDDLAMQRLVSMLLRRAGYRVDVVSEGSQAIERIRQHDYAALLLDVMTPTEGGLTVIRHLKEKNPAMLDRVLLVTGSPDSLLKSFAGDVHGIVHKPFRADELLAALEEVTKQK